MIAVPASTADARNLWARLSRNQRIMLGGLAAASAVLVAISVLMTRPPEYAVAFSGLRDEDAAAVVAKLKDAKVPYELAGQGTIKVPAGQVQEVKLMAASAGLLKGSGTGFELFNQPHFGLTEFAEKVNYQRALEGELSRSITRLEVVETARVHLVIPAPALFASEKKDATAAVVVNLKPGRRLDPAQVQGITQLVSGSVEGLKSQAVTIMDSSGNVLNDRQAQNDPSRMSTSRAEIQRSLETRLTDDVKSMLAQVIGPDKSVVRVSAELDWDQYEANSETFSPAQKAPQVRSRREISELSTSANASTGGAPGTASNIPSYPAGSVNGNGTSGAERRDTTTNYELSKTQEKTVRAPGGVKRLNVAVALDSEIVADPAQVDAISKLVATAAGLDTTRGDLVTLTTLPFNPSGEKRPMDVAEAARQREMYVSMARVSAMVVGPLLVLLMVWLILRRKRPKELKPAITVEAQGAAALPAGTSVTADGEEGAINESTTSTYKLAAAAVEDPEEKRIREELMEIAEREPATVANLIRTWLQEERRGT